MHELASLEEIRRLEIVVAEKCAQNWREEPVFGKPVGFVPGKRQVRVGGVRLRLTWCP